MQHTSASLTINENYDSDVRDDTETFLNRVVPEVNFCCFLFGLLFKIVAMCVIIFYSNSNLLLQGRTAPWKHTMEG